MSLNESVDTPGPDHNQALCADFKTSLNIVEKYYFKLFHSVAQHLKLMLGEYLIVYEYK